EPSLRTDCGTDSEPLPDGTCTATGLTSCPSARFADVDSVRGTDPVFYVDASANPSLADGTLAHPYATLAPALAHCGRYVDCARTRRLRRAAGDHDARESRGRLRGTRSDHVDRHRAAARRLRRDGAST